MEPEAEGWRRSESSLSLAPSLGVGDEGLDEGNIRLKRERRPRSRSFIDGWDQEFALLTVRRLSSGANFTGNASYWLLLNRYKLKLLGQECRYYFWLTPVQLESDCWLAVGFKFSATFSQRCGYCRVHVALNKMTTLDGIHIELALTADDPNLLSSGPEAFAPLYPSKSAVPVLSNSCHAISSAPYSAHHTNP